MSCELFKDRLSEYIDLSLPPGQHEAVDAHLKHCAICDVVYQDLLAISRASRQMPEVEPPDRIWRNLEVALALEVGQRSQDRAGAFADPAVAGAGASRSFWRPVYLMAATLLVAAGVFAAYRWGGGVPGRETAPPEIAVKDTSNWPEGGGNTTQIRPINLVVVHKPYIEPEIVQQRIGQLTKEIDRRQSRWPADLKTVFHQDLSEVNRNVEQSLEFLNTHPGDGAATEVYQAALLSKVELLRLFAEL